MVAGSKWRNTSGLPASLRQGRRWRGGWPPTRIALGPRWVASSSSRRRRWRGLDEDSYRYPTITGTPRRLIREASIRIWDLDFHEIFGDPHILEDFFRVLEDFRRVLIPRAQVSQHEESHPGLFRDLRRLARGRVPVPIRLLLQGGVRGRIVDQDVRMAGDLDEGLVRHRVPRIDDLAAPPRRAEHILRTDRAAAHPHRLAVLQPAVHRPGRDPEDLCAFDAEPAGSRLLLEDVAQAGDRVDSFVRLHRVLAAVGLRAGRQFLRLDREAGREVAERQQLADEPLDPAGPVHLKGRLPSVHRHALHHPREAEEVVAVEVRDEDAGDLHEAQRALHELTLRALTAVEQDHLGTAFDRDRAHVSLRRGPRSGRPEEHDLHGFGSRWPAGT